MRNLNQSNLGNLRQYLKQTTLYHNEIFKRIKNQNVF